MSNAIKVWLCQVVLGILAILLVSLWHPAWFLSVVLGVVTMWVATFFLIFRLWRIESRFGQGKPKVIRSFYSGQIVKYVIVIAAVLICLHWLTLNWLAFMIGIIVVQLSGMFMTTNVKGALSQ